MSNIRIVLLGPMGAGKTTIGTIISKQLGIPYIDNDSELPKFSGKSLDELANIPFQELHTYELKYLEHLVNRVDSFIGGAAASVIDYEEGRELLKKTWNVYLYLPLEQQLARAGAKGIGRQALSENGKRVIEERFKRRDPLYRQAANLVLELGSDPKTDAQKIISALTTS